MPEDKVITNPVKVIRAFCLDCVGGSAAEVRDCTGYGCKLYPFRMGKNPYRTPKTISAEQRDKLIQGRKEKSKLDENSSMVEEITGESNE